MKNKTKIFHPIKLIGTLVFLMAFMLNIQTSLNGEWELVSVGFAQDTGGEDDNSGGDCTNCGNTDEDACQRVVVGNVTHYFSGPKSTCD